MDSVNWPEWVSAILAAIAIALSQAPPISKWFRRRSVVVEIDRRIGISQSFGVPGLQTYLSLRNCGAKPERIKAIKFTIQSDGIEAFDLVVETVFQMTDSPMPVTFFPTLIAADEEWGHLVNATTQLDMGTEKHLSRLRGQLVEAVMSYRQRDSEYSNAAQVARSTGQALPAPPVPVIYGDLIKQAHHEFEKRKRWVEGEFTMQVAVITQDQTFKSRWHRFTVFESQAGDLKSQVDAYASGVGLIHGQNTYPVFCKVNTAAADGS